MPRTLSAANHLPEADLEERARPAGKSALEWARWRAVLLWTRGESARDISVALGFNEDWVRRTVRRYNASGPNGMRDGRKDNAPETLVGPELMAALVEAVEHSDPEGGGRWNGYKVHAWLNARLPKPIHLATAHDVLHRAKLSWQVPRPRHADADDKAQDQFKKNT